MHLNKTINHRIVRNARKTNQQLLRPRALQLSQKHANDATCLSYSFKGESPGAQEKRYTPVLFHP